MQRCVSVFELIEFCLLKLCGLRVHCWDISGVIYFKIGLMTISHTQIYQAMCWIGFKNKIKRHRLSAQMLADLWEFDLGSFTLASDFGNFKSVASCLLCIDEVCYGSLHILIACAVKDMLIRDLYITSYISTQSLMLDLLNSFTCFMYYLCVLEMVFNLNQEPCF